MEMRSSLGRARGLGSAKEGVHHWWGQRVSAIALVPLSLWFVASVIGQIGMNWLEFREWIGFFGNAVLMIVLVAVLFYHAFAGMQVVIEDYVHNEGAKVVTLVIVKFALAIMGVSCILAVLRMAVGV
jgi:succinate dehydrogenase / fumarate reductase, membrane anchor subunit